MLFEIYIRTLHALINDVVANNKIIEQLKLIANNKSNMDLSIIVGKKILNINQIIDLLESSNIIYNKKMEDDLMQLFSEVERYYNYFGKNYFVN